MIFLKVKPFLQSHYISLDIIMTSLIYIPV